MTLVRRHFRASMADLALGRGAVGGGRGCLVVIVILAVMGWGGVEGGSRFVYQIRLVCFVGYTCIIRDEVLG
ncbi:hypothetical protein ASPWEDRAFT_344525 [Aspergillus wentii DTO 134E9]|uniref:Uncharacterized protein n=1 Tax=Aspergillus wentii DTO 134E9 TaxID=1073089 RepID=A0A1L9RVB8_ASPWE|nr:uncharacterized protein ASPWEDRAFT_344525 [Aspergillus wentii DTO 134E9]OJJ38869.1 hypothetical protein ASPWEDRAFT_344525 [Aspergillus wentii DTO 134E9]